MQNKFHLPGLCLALSACTLMIWSCTNKKEKSGLKQKSVTYASSFNADSAFAFIATQVAFGPRIPNTKAHRVAGDFIVARLKAYGATVVVQEFQATTFDAHNLSLRNIIGSYNPKMQKRVLLAAHWDTRPYADKDSLNPDSPFDGANDGASGVAVLLEIARHLGGDSPPNIGIDIIFFDGEDWGEKNNSKKSVVLSAGWDSWWCLGSQHWSKNRHHPRYQAYYGILLDMVGARNARFVQEGNSEVYAPEIVTKVWSTAARMGYSSVFIQQKAEPIVDDHLFVNELAKIPMIDITHYEPGIGYFGSYHHTQKDNLALISRETLEIVGRVVMRVIHDEE